MKETAMTELKTEMKSVSSAITEAVAKLKAEAEAKVETANAANAKSALTSLIKSNTDLESTNSWKAPRGFTNIKGPKNLCIRGRNRGRIYQGSCKGNPAKWKFIKVRGNKRKCYFHYCNKYRDLKKAFCSGRTCRKNSHYKKCKKHWFQYGRKEKRFPNPETCTNGSYMVINTRGQVLDVHGAKINNGAKIYSDKRNNGGNQKWSFIKIGGGKFMLKSLKSNKCLDNTGKARAGKGYHQWTCSRRNKNQHFRYTKLRSKRPAAKKARKAPRKPKGKAPRRPKGKGKAPRRPKGKGKAPRRPKGKGKAPRRPKGKGKAPRRPKGKGKAPRRPKGKGKAPRRPKGKGKRKLAARRAKKAPVIKRALKKLGKKMRNRKTKTLKFIKGKYKFNLKTGRKFCQTKCSNNKHAKLGICFKKGVKKCKPCSFTGNKKTKKGKESNQLCSIVCRSIDKQTCDFYAYTDDKKKVVNKKLLNRFGKIFVSKFLQLHR